jgi:hypothetical protein
MIFRRKRRNGGTATAERPEPSSKDPEELLAEIDALTRQNREQRNRERESRLITLRHRCGAALAQGPTPAGLEYPEPDFAGLPERSGADLPEFAPADVTPELLRAAILRDGCMLVRGVIEPARALELADEIDDVFAQRDLFDENRPTGGDLYEPIFPDEPYEVGERPWIKEGGGVLAADSPPLLFEMLDTLERANLMNVIGAYLGQRPLISVNKCTLRKAEPSVPGAWHQDGAFMGEEVRAMNVWLSLSRCGDEAPGLDLVPRRLEDYVRAGGEGTYLDFQVSAEMAREAAGELGIIRPIFEPGDALLFDHLFLHQTGSSPEMPKARYALESWFFGTSGFTDYYVPLVA